MKRVWKEIFFDLFLVCCGALLGILSKAGDIAVTGSSLIGNLFYGFGLVSSGFFIWLVAGYAIASMSENAWFAAMHIFLFFLPMLTSYYLYSYFVVHYLSRRVLRWWIASLLPVSVLGFLVKRIPKTPVVKGIYLFAGVCCFLYDIFVIQSLFLPSFVLEVLLMAIYIFLWKRSVRARRK